MPKARMWSSSQARTGSKRGSSTLLKKGHRRWTQGGVLGLHTQIRNGSGLLGNVVTSCSPGCGKSRSPAHRSADSGLSALALFFNAKFLSLIHI
eukprot:5915262-Alexandrium_andersonii.AAC.1